MICITFFSLQKRNINLRFSHWRCSYVRGDLRYDANLPEEYQRWSKFLLNVGPSFYESFLHRVCSLSVLM